MSATLVPIRGTATATPENVAYRLSRIERYLHGGTWLDFGCADGGYSGALLAHGAEEVIGVDVEPDRIVAARERALERASFSDFDGQHLPLGDRCVDGAFVNEVLEHVADERGALEELHRVLKPDGTLVVISPNRWFPFEGHGIRIGRYTSGPAPLVPWLPERLTRHVLEARNYWPHQLVELVRGAGFAIREVGFVWPVFEEYPWLPERLTAAYRRRMQRLDDLPGLRRLGVSTLVVAQPT